MQSSQRTLGIGCMAVAVVVCLVGLVTLAVMGEGARQFRNVVAQQGVTSQSDAIAGVYFQLGSSLIMPAVYLGTFLAWIVGLVGYLIYPSATLKSSAARKVGDAVAIIAGGAMGLLMLRTVVVSTFNAIRPAAGISVNGVLYLVILVIGLLLIALGAAVVRKGVLSLRPSLRSQETP